MMFLIEKSNGLAVCAAIGVPGDKASARQAELTSADARRSDVFDTVRIGEESDRLADENGRRETQKRDAKIIIQRGRSNC